MDKQKYKSLIEVIYKFQVGIFKAFGYWELPAEFGRNLHRLYACHFYHVLIFWVLLMDLLLFVQFLNYIHDIDEIINIFFIFTSLVGNLPKAFTVKTKQRKFENLFKTFELEKFLPRNQREADIFEQHMQVGRLIRNIYTAASFVALNGIFFLRGSELPFNIYIPYSLEQTYALVPTYIYEYISVGIGCFTNIAFDSMAPLLLVFVKAQLTMLGDRLRHLNGADQKMNDKLIKAEIKACMRHYEDILGLIGQIEELISLPFSIQLFLSILVLVANFYALAKLSEVNDYAAVFGIVTYQGAMLMQIFFICYFANDVTLTASKLSYELFSCEWTSFNKENRRLAFLMMMSLDLPVKLKSINRNLCFDLAVFTSIVNSSYSYFALLQQVNK